MVRKLKLVRVFLTTKKKVQNFHEIAINPCVVVEKLHVSANSVASLMMIYKLYYILLTNIGGLKLQNFVFKIKPIIVSSNKKSEHFQSGVLFLLFVSYSRSFSLYNYFNRDSNDFLKIQKIFPVSRKPV